MIFDCRSGAVELSSWRLDFGLKKGSAGPGHPAQRPFLADCHQARSLSRCADCKSAIRRVENLRYGDVSGDGSRRFCNFAFSYGRSMAEVVGHLWSNQKVRIKRPWFCKSGSDKVLRTGRGLIQRFSGAVWKTFPAVDTRKCFPKFAIHDFRGLGGRRRARRRHQIIGFCMVS